MKKVVAFCTTTFSFAADNAGAGWCFISAFSVNIQLQIPSSFNCDEILVMWCFDQHRVKKSWQLETMANYWGTSMLCKAQKHSNAGFKIKRFMTRKKSLLWTSVVGKELYMWTWIQKQLLVQADFLWTGSTWPPLLKLNTKWQLCIDSLYSQQTW